MTLPQVIPNSPQWKDCLRYIAQRVNEQSFNTWFKPTRGGINGDGQFYLAVPNQFVADWIKGHFGEVIDEAFREVLGSSYQLEFVIAQIPEVPEQNALNLELPLPERPEPLPVPQTQPLGRRHDHNLNRKYTFDSLVVGDFNQFAFAAAQAVAEAPGLNKYNPLFIYGGTGLGKTHIVQAIGNAILEAFPNKRIFYATSEKFTSDFIASISDRTIADFTKVYRDVDVLIIDDIQFFSGKESTQEQFFHTFNSLHHLGKMIVLTADRPPREIKGLEERLLSRFQWGLVADLQAPDLENRTAILYKKLETEGITLPDNIVRYIADQVQSNVRELEGALIRLAAKSSLTGCPVDLEFARAELLSVPTRRTEHMSVQDIQRAVCSHFRLSNGELLSKDRHKSVAFARQVAMYLCRQRLKCSYPELGRAFGNRDHTTAMSAVRRVEALRQTDPQVNAHLEAIEQRLASSDE